MREALRLVIEGVAFNYLFFTTVKWPLDMKKDVVLCLYRKKVVILQIFP